MFILITAMGMIWISWLLLFLLFSGWGFLLQRLLGRVVTTGHLLFDSFWLGWVGVLLILQLLHFVVAINDLIFIGFALIGGLSFVWHLRFVIPILRRLRSYSKFIALLILTLLWLGSRAVDMPTAYDTGFRDIQAVMWIDTYPLVTGLNNLFSSLAFNHSSYLYHALLDVSVWSGRAYHISTGLMFVVFITQSIWSGLQLIRTRSHPEQVRWSWIVSVILLPYLLFDTVPRGGITHFLTDTTVDLFGFVITMYLLDFLQLYQVKQRQDNYYVLRLALMIIAGLTLKQSFIILGLALSVLIIVVWVVRGGLSQGVRRFAQLAIPVILFGILMIVPWMVRGVVTSGYIAYPQSFGRVDVEWAEPIKLIRERQEMLATNTRLRYGDPDEVLNSWMWLGPWLDELKTDYIDFVIPFVMTIGALLLVVIGRWLGDYRKQSEPIGLWVLLPMLVMIVVWFMTAPNVKYIRYVLWIVASVSIVLAVVTWSHIAWQRRMYAIFAVFVPCVLYFVYLVFATSALTLGAGSDNGLHVRPMPPIKVYVTDSGVELNVPDSHITQCWDIPLPCTPFTRKGIYERVPGEIRYGFGWTDDTS